MMASTGEEANVVAPESKTTPKRDSWITIDTKTKSPVEHSSTARYFNMILTLYEPAVYSYQSDSSL